MLQNAKGNYIENLGLGVGVMDKMDDIVGGTKIASTVWETTNIPEQLAAKLSGATQVWIPSKWGKKVLVDNGIPIERIRVVPEGVAEDIDRPLERPERMQSEQVYRFLMIGKWEARKGVDVLLEAYSKAFSSGDRVELLLRCSGSSAGNREWEDEMRKLAEGLKLPVRFSPYLTERALVHLYNYCDALVLPSRAEGWGLPVIEAMSCRKPVIVTNYSGYLDYVDESNGYLVDVDRMVDATDGDQFRPGNNFGQWAQPDTDHLASILRHVYENQDEARSKGIRAREQVVDKWTWTHAARKAWDEIERLAE